MKNALLITAIALLAGLAACGTGKPEAQKANGQVKFSAMTKLAVPGMSAQPASGTPASVCADFSLQPVSINAAGNQTPAGSPIVITSTGTSQTDAIIGCIDPGDAAISPNWGYQVTASHFVDCVTHQPIPGLSPATAFTNATVQCVAGRDVSLDVTVNVSIAVPNQGGYVDISVSVNSTQVQIGCKEADMSGANMLHFGQSNIDAAGHIAQGLTGLDFGAPQQWGGTIFAGAAPALDTYYTGAIDLSKNPTTLVYQTFLSPCAKGESFADAHHAQCITNTKPSLSTAASLADAFMESANGFASASVAANQSSVIIYSDYVLSPTKLSDASVPKTGYNTGTAQFTVGPLAAPDVFTGVFVDQGKPDTLAVTGTIGGVPSAAQVTFDGTKWVLGTWFDLSKLTAADIACHGLFTSPAGCFTPKACAAAVSADCSKAYQSYSAQVVNLCGASAVAALIGDAATYCADPLASRCQAAYSGYLKGFSGTGAANCSTAKPLDQACSLTRLEQGVICLCH